MKLRIGALTVLFLSLALPLAAQVGGGGTTNYIPIWTDSNTLGDSTIYETNGMVGVGTTSPTATLTVLGANGGAAQTPVLQVTGGMGGSGLVGAVASSLQEVLAGVAAAARSRLREATGAQMVQRTVRLGEQSSSAAAREALDRRFLKLARVVRSQSLVALEGHQIPQAEAVTAVRLLCKRGPRLS